MSEYQILILSSQAKFAQNVPRQDQIHDGSLNRLILELNSTKWTFLVILIMAETAPAPKHLVEGIYPAGNFRWSTDKSKHLGRVMSPRLILLSGYLFY